MKVTVVFADGTTQEHVLKNGETFADTFARADVPLSTRRRRLHAPRTAALLRGESRQSAQRSRRSCSRATTTTSSRSRSRSRRAANRRPLRQGSGQARRQAPARSQAPGRRLPATPGRRKADGRRSAAGDEADRLGAGQDEGPHHRRRQLAQLRPVLRRHRRRDAHRRRVQRELHRGSRSGRGRDRQGRRRGRQRQPAVLRHARVPQGALRLRRRRQGPRHAAPGHVVRLRRSGRS